MRVGVDRGHPYEVLGAAGEASGAGPGVVDSDCLAIGASPAPWRKWGSTSILTRERIGQIEAWAMSKLRHPSSDTGARELLNL